MAFALGYIKAAAKAVGLPVDDGPPNPHIDPLLPTEAAVGRTGAAAKGGEQRIPKIESLVTSHQSSRPKKHHPPESKRFYS